MSRDLEQVWLDEGYELGELKGFKGLSLELFADGYVEMQRSIYEWRWYGVNDLFESTTFLC